MDAYRFLNFFREAFNERVKENPNFRESIAGFDRIITVILSDGGNYQFGILGCQVSPIRKGVYTGADIQIHTDKENMVAILSGKLSPVVALMSGKVTIDGSIPDVMWLQWFINNNARDIATLVESFELKG